MGGMSSEVRERILPPLPPEVSGGFRGFLHRLTTRGLEVFGLYYGIYRAVVIDPGATTHRELDGAYGWLRVSVPALGDPGDSGRVAWPAVPMAGEGRGFHSLPQVGDRVLVVFEAGRPDAPLWIGSWWVRGDIPDGLESADKHWWVTPGGHKIMLDDSDGGETLTVEHSGGAKIEIDSAGSVTVEAESGQKITLGSGSLEAAVKADKLIGILESVLDGLSTLTVGTLVGPSTVPVNAATFIAARARLETIKSQIVEVG